MTNLPLMGEFKVSLEFGRKNTPQLSWGAGYHPGIDLVGSDTIYSTCNGIVVRRGYDSKYGNFIVVRNDDDGKYHWLCHLAKILKNTGSKVTRASVVGIMGATGRVTGKHVHFEIRNASNTYGDVSNPAEYMGIPNQVGTYNSKNYPVQEKSKPIEPVLKTLARNTNLRTAPNTSAKATLYLKNTTLYVLQPGVANADGYIWDKVKIRVNGKEGFMINKNYK
jgi:hypothetical protein